MSNKETHFSAAQNVLTVRRTFAAGIDLVWRAWTEADLLDQWWAPQPWKSRTSNMDFVVGGHRLYAMVGPEGQEHWGKTTYLAIDLKQSFGGEDAFCDEEGRVNEAMPVAVFSNEFEGADATTTVTIVTEYASEDHLKQVIEMGMKEGLTLAFTHLDELISKTKA